jgi:hypothetical protein
MVTFKIIIPKEKVNEFVQSFGFEETPSFYLALTTFESQEVPLMETVVEIDEKDIRRFNYVVALHEGTLIVSDEEEKDEEMEELNLLLITAGYNVEEMKASF